MLYPILFKFMYSGETELLSWYMHLRIDLCMSQEAQDRDIGGVIHEIAKRN